MTQAMVFVACGLLVGDRVLDLVDADVANPLQLPVTAVSVSGEGGVSSHG